MLLTNCFDPDPRVYNEARSLVERGYTVRILAWDRDLLRPESESIDGIEIRRIFVRSRHGRGVGQLFVMPAVFLAMLKLGLAFKFDLVHAHDFDTLPVAMMLGRLRSKPVVYDSHEDYAGMLHGSVPQWLECLIRWAETKMVRRVNLLLTVGETLRQQFEDRGCKNARVLGNWKSLNEFAVPEETRARVRKELAIPSHSLLVLYISNLGRERHILELLEAAAQRPDIHVVVGGTGPAAAAVQEYAAKYTNVHYLGFVQQYQIPAYTAACDIVYYGYELTSPNAKFSAPNKLFEALAAGRPLLTAKFGEIGRIVAEYGCGLVLKDYSVSEILRGLHLCTDVDHLKQMKTAAARAGKGEYNWDRAEQVLLSGYQELIPRSPQYKADRTSEAIAR